MLDVLLQACVTSLITSLITCRRRLFLDVLTTVPWDAVALALAPDVHNDAGRRDRSVKYRLYR